MHFQERDLFCCSFRMHSQYYELANLILISSVMLSLRFSIDPLSQENVSLIICLINRAWVQPRCLLRSLPSDQDKILIFHEEQNCNFLHGQITGVICSHTLMQFQLEAPPSCPDYRAYGTERRPPCQVAVGWSVGKPGGGGTDCTRTPPSVERSHTSPIGQPTGMSPKYTDKNKFFFLKSLNFFHVKWNYLHNSLHKIDISSSRGEKILEEFKIEMLKTCWMPGCMLSYYVIPFIALITSSHSCKFVDLLSPPLEWESQESGVRCVLLMAGLPQLSPVPGTQKELYKCLDQWVNQQSLPRV